MGKKKSYRKISELYDVSKPGINRIIKRLWQRKTNENKPRTGRPKELKRPIDYWLGITRLILARLLSNLIQLWVSFMAQTVALIQLNVDYLKIICMAVV